MEGSVMAMAMVMAREEQLDIRTAVVEHLWAAVAICFASISSIVACINRQLRLMDIVSLPPAILML